MAAPTSLSVVVDREEYSRFEIEQGRSIVNISITASGGGNMSGQQLTLSINKARRLRDQSIYSLTYTIAGTTDPTIEVITVDLNSLTDSAYISLIRRGRFFIKVVSVSSPNVQAISSDFPISICTAQFLRETYLFGLGLDATDVRSVKTQPSQITGVEVLEVNQTHPMGFCTLNYRYDATLGIKHLSWGSGGPVVAITRVGRYLLRKGCSQDYIVVYVGDLTELPTEDIQEELLVTKAAIQDGQLRTWINQACDWLENDKLAHVYLEPTRLVTDPILPGNVLPDWDVIVNPLTFYPVTPDKWVEIQFPYSSLLKVEELFGQLADTRIVDIDLSWLEIAEKNGYAQLVPFNTMMAFRFIGLVWVESLRGAIELPNFWHFTAVAGLRQVDPVLLEIIAKKASMDTLTVAGHAYRGGFSSQSISRDGVSEQVSYTASAIYGIFSATIADYEKFINKEIKQLKGRYRGVGMCVV